MPRHAPSRTPNAFGHKRDYIRLLQSRSRVLLLSAVFFLFAPMWLISVSRYAAHDACQAILREVDALSGANAQDDDMSVLAIRRTGSTA